MSDTSDPATVDFGHPEAPSDRFENAWCAWRAGAEPPRWERFLPATGEPCSPDLIFQLVQIDIEFRAKAGLPALLAERYFEHPRLQRADARLDGEQQVELIRWDYQQRWQHGQRAQRSDYQAGFPQHAGALSDLQPRFPCPRCRQVLVLEETTQTVHCPACKSDAPLTGASPPYMGETTAPPVALAGLGLHGYEILSELGRGGMGVVYKARQVPLNRLVALKMILAGGYAGPEELGRFRAEAEAVARLQHPNFIQIYEIGEAEGRPFLSLELVEGGSLAQRLDGTPWPARQAAEFAAILCRTMHYAHQHGVIHRDLKPANVLLTSEGQPKITDFGLAKRLDAEAGQTRTGMIRGTPPALPHAKPAQVELWDTASGRPRRAWPLPRGEIDHLCFSPSGRWLAGVSRVMDSSGFGFAGSDVRVWNTASGTERLSLSFPKVHVKRVCFSPDSTLLAIVGGVGMNQPGFVKLWDVGTGTERRSFQGHTALVEDVCFSPDGARLATASGLWDTQNRNYAGGEVKLWDVAGGQETLSLRRPNRWPMQHVAFSPDGRLLATGDAGGVVRLWRGGDPWQARPLQRPGDIRRLGFRDEGRRLVVLAQPSARGVGLRPDELPAPELFAWDTRTGEEVLAAKDDMPADARQAAGPDDGLFAVTDGWEVRVRRRADLTPEAQARLREEERQAGLAWHFQQAAEAEKAKHWFAARFHLDRLIEALPDDAALKARRAAVPVPQ